MDGQRFDAMTRRMAAGVSRRRLIGAAVSGMAGAALAALGRGGAATAAPNRCAQACAFEPKGPRQAACRQACKQCGGSTINVCFGETIQCCPPGTLCDGFGCVPPATCDATSGCFGGLCGPDCFCVSSVEGDGACVSAAYADCFAAPCETSDDCGGGFCVDATECCGGPTKVCFPAEATCAASGARGGTANSAPAWRTRKRTNRR